MKKYLLTFALVLCTLPAFSQPFFWQQEKIWSVSTGWKHYSLNSGVYDVGQLELSTYVNPTLGWEFVAKLEWGKGYFSFSPVGLIGLPLLIYSSTHGGDRALNMIGAFSSIACAKIPIYVADWFEITPQWDLLKFTKTDCFDKLKLNASVGLSMRFYPFCELWPMNTFFISPFVDFDFAYKKHLADYWGEQHYRLKNTRSQLFGYSFGITAGMWF